MSILKIKFGLFSLLGALVISVLLTSCEQDLLVLKQEEVVNIPLPPDEYLTLTLDFDSAPDVSSVPVKTPENTATPNLSDRACLQYNSWNTFDQIGDIYVYEYPASWVWSSKYQDFIWLFNQTDICDYGLSFHTHKPICGESGLMWDNSANNNTLWHHTCEDGTAGGGSQWKMYSTTSCNGLGWVKPLVESNLVSSDHGCRNLGDGFHSGLDFGHIDGAWKVDGKPVRAVAAGTVVESFDNYGTVTIDHGSYLTRYLHMQNRISNGSQVSAGQQIGTVSGLGAGGAFGAFTPHLHFEYYSTDNLPIGNADKRAENPTVNICHIQNINIQKADTQSGRINFSEFCERRGVQI